jgi:MoaA/NifB/PqqE/SkfB family radical SAM enzyme
MCDLWKRYIEHPELVRSELETEELKKLIDGFKELGTKIIILGGGEPFLRSDLVDLVRHTRKLGLSNLIDTNGTLITERIAKDMTNAGLDVLMVSIDGARSATHDYHRGVEGTFERAVNGIRNVQNLKSEVKVCFSTTITSKNFRELPEIIDLANNLGVYGVKFQPVNISPFISKSVESKERLLLLDRKETSLLNGIMDRVIEKIRTYGLHTDPLPYLKGIPLYFENPKRRWGTCYAGYLGCNVRPDGILDVCASFTAMGNVREAPLDELWLSSKFRHVRKRIRTGNCSGCYLKCSAYPSLRTTLKFVVQDVLTSRSLLRDIEFYLS